MKNCDIAIFDEPSQAIPWVTQYETETYEGECSVVVKDTPFDLFIDIGAAFGYYSALAANKPNSPRVIAVEASPIRCGFMKWSIGHLRNVDVYNEYVGTIPPTRPSATFGMVSAFDETKEVKLDIEPFDLNDHLVFEHEMNPDAKIFIKIDIEGGELNVLESCPDGVRYPNVAWFIEVHRQFVSDKQICDFFPNREPIVYQDHGDYVKLYFMAR